MTSRQQQTRRFTTHIRSSVLGAAALLARKSLAITIVYCLVLQGAVFGVGGLTVATAAPAGVLQPEVVNTVDDVNDGACTLVHCSLREALLRSNANAGTDTVSFAIPGSGVRSIRPLSDLPLLSDAVVLDASTQPGYVGVPLVELDGSLVTAGNRIGLWVIGGASTIRGLVVNRWANRAILVESSGNTVVGNYLGTTADGLAKAADFSFGALEIRNGANNVVGGTSAADRNVIVGGVTISFAAATGNMIQGNYIGTNAAGTAGVSSRLGVFITGGSNNTIGGTAAGAGNVISGSSSGNGVEINNGGSGIASGNVVQGNLIGTNAAGDAAIGNLAAGVVLFVGNNTVGGTAAGAGNVIAGNGGDGVRIQGQNAIVQGNRIGITVTGAPLGNTSDGVILIGGTAQNNLIGGTAVGAGNTIAYNGGAGVAVLNGTGHQILRNSITNNVGLGIDIGSGARDGVTVNDAGDGDSGANNRQNFPVLSSVTAGAPGAITGRVDSGAGIYTIEFYRVSTCHSSGNGQGANYIDTLNTAANTDFTLNTALTVGDIITATATDATGNTSEFSTCTTTGPPTATTLALVSSKNPSGLGSSVTFTATVSGSGTPTGQVEFFDAAVSLGTALLSDNAASFTTSALSLGSHAISAVYGGDGAYLGATGNLTQVVTYNEAHCVLPNQVLVVLAPQDLSNNQLTSSSCLFVMAERSGVVLTAPLGVDASQVLSVFGSVLPVGSVVNSWIAHSDVPTSLASGTYAGSFDLPVGQRLIGLIHDGAKLTASDAIVGSLSSTYGPYPSPTWRQLDGGEGTVTTTYDPLTDIERVRFATFNTFTAIDQVRFLTGTVPLPNVIVVKNTVGGDGAFTFSLTNRAAEVVTTAAGTGTTSWPVVTAGAATLTETAVAGWSLTSAVCVRNGVVYPSTVTTGGVALTINPGSDITCTFTNSIPQTSLSLSTSKNPSALGESVTFTASVSSTFGSPTGFVDFYDGAVLLGSSLLVDGVASVSTSSLTLGSHTITANYLGQSPFAPSSGTLVQGVRLIDSDLALTKEGPPTANAGEELTFTIKVKNNGPDIATNVLVNDTLPSGLEWVSSQPTAPACVGNVTIVCNLGTLIVGETKTATIVARAKQAGPVHNDATTTSDPGDSNPTNNTGGWTTNVGPAPTVRVQKGVAVLTGPRLRYTIDVENLGPTTAYGVVAKDILDPAWTLISVQTTQGVCDARVVCAIGTLALGATATVIIEIGVFTVAPVYNEVTGTWHGGGIVVTGVTSPALPHVVVSKSHQGDFVAGGIGTYTVAVSNIGSGPTTRDIIVTDTLPTGMTFAGSSGGDFTCVAVAQKVTCTRTTPLAAAASVSFTLTVNVAADAPRQPTNYVEIGGGGGFFQHDPSGDPGTIIEPTSLGVRKTVKERVVRIGHNFTYLIDVTNTGTRTASNVQVIDTIPGSVDLVSITPGAPTCTGTSTIACNLGDLPVGQTVTVEIIVKPREITVLTNEAFGRADGVLPVSSGTVGTSVLPDGVIGIEKEADKPVVLQDSLLRYTITAKNLGPGDATNVKINDPLPVGVTLVSVQPDATYGMTCNVTAPPEITNLVGPVVCTIPVLPELTTSKVVLVVRVLRVGLLTNSACITSDDTNPGTGTGCGGDTVDVVPPQSISVDKVTVPGGSPDGFDFQLRRLGDSSLVGSITGLRDAASPKTFVTVAPGTYKVEESLPTSWKLTSSVCDNTASAALESVGAGNLTVVAGEHWRCTFTNTKQGSIVVNKQTVPASLSPSFAFVSSYAPGSFSLSGGGTNTSGSLDAGTYSVAETPVAGWTLTSSCDDGSLVSAIRLDAGETVTCTFTNTKQGVPHLTVTKTQRNQDGNQDDPTTQESNINVRLGDRVLYTVVVTNDGTAPATSVVIRDSLPAGMRLVVGSPTQPCTGTSTIVCTWTPPLILNPGASRTISFTVQVVLSCDIVGTRFRDILTGTNGPERICGAGANDELRGLGGEDTIYGYGPAGSGAGPTDPVPVGTTFTNTAKASATSVPEVTSSVVATLVEGTDLRDEIFGGDSNDTIFGQDGNDTLAGEAGNDTMSGGAGNDTMSGNDGQDVVAGGPGQDDLSGGGDDDWVHGDQDPDDVRGDGGNDLVSGDGGNDLVSGGGGNDFVSGDAGDDTLSGGAGRDRLTGGDHNDTLRGDAGDDGFANGGCNQTVFPLFAVDGHFVTNGERKLGFVERLGGLYGEDGSDILSGGGGCDDLFGGGGGDDLFGNAGDDRLAGDSSYSVDDTVGGNDRLFGGDGHDLLLGQVGDDVLSGEAGNDRIHGGSGNDSIVGGAGIDRLKGGDGGTDTCTTKPVDFVDPTCDNITQGVSRIGDSVFAWAAAPTTP